MEGVGEKSVVQYLVDENLIGMGTVDGGGVEEGDASMVDGGNHVILRLGCAVLGG